MKNLTKMLGLVCMGGLISISTAQAEDGQKKGRPDRPGGEDRRQKMLEKFDADGDGKLNEAEKAKLHEELGKQRGGPGGPGGRRPSPELRKKLLAEFDADKDGKLNEEERAKARAAMRERHGDRPGGPGDGKGKKKGHKKGHKKDGKQDGKKDGEAL